MFLKCQKAKFDPKATSLNKGGHPILIDRGHRELPICADYVGKALEVSKQDSVNVELKELAGVDQVVIEYGKYPNH